MRALDDLVRAGKVRYVGVSNFAGWQVVRALWAADRGGMSPCVSTQAVYSLLARNAETELFPACAAAGVGVLAYSTLAAGLLSGADGGQTPRPGSLLAARASYQASYWTEANRGRTLRLADHAARLGRAPAELAVAWGLGHPAVSAAIVGALHPDELDAYAAAADRPLGPDERMALEQDLEGFS